MSEYNITIVVFGDHSELDWFLEHEPRDQLGLFLQDSKYQDSGTLEV